MRSNQPSVSQKFVHNPTFFHRIKQDTSVWLGDSGQKVSGTAIRQHERGVAVENADGSGPRRVEAAIFRCRRLRRSG